MVTEIFPAYEEFLQPARFKVPYGGRGSAKTRQVTSILKNNVLCYSWRLACFREVMKSIRDSVYQEFIDEIERCNESHYFDIQAGLIQLANPVDKKYGRGKINFGGLLRNQQAVKGYANYDAFWVEEAENVSADSWKYLIPTLRRDDSELWITFNPDDPLSETYQRFVTKRMYPDYKDGKRYCIVKRINYVDNPRFPQSLHDDMELMKAADYEMYRHVYLGEPVGNSNLAIIKPHWIQAAIDAHIKLDIKPTGGRIGGFDVADEGPDSNAFIWRHGMVVQDCEEWKDTDPNTAARHVFNRCIKIGIDRLNYDNIGVGAGAKGAIREELDGLSVKVRPPKFVGFTANAAVYQPTADYAPGKKNEDMFLNLKSQTWWNVADRFRNTYDAINGKPYNENMLISIPSNLPHLEKLCGELAQPRREFKNGKFSVESKKDMAKRGVVSPNLADSLIMCFAPDSSFNLEALL